MHILLGLSDFVLQVTRSTDLVRVELSQLSTLTTPPISPIHCRPAYHCNKHCHQYQLLYNNSFTAFSTCLYIVITLIRGVFFLLYILASMLCVFSYTVRESKRQLCVCVYVCVLCQQIASKEGYLTKLGYHRKVSFNWVFIMDIFIPTLVCLSVCLSVRPSICPSLSLSPSPLPPLSLSSLTHTHRRGVFAGLFSSKMS